jgi:hypothetical protein
LIFETCKSVNVIHPGNLPNGMKIYDIAHSRAGDKGNTLTLSLVAYREKDYPLLREKATAEKVKEHLKAIVKGDIVRYEHPNVSSLLFVCHPAPGDGVASSLPMEAQGKALSYALLQMEI